MRTPWTHGNRLVGVDLDPPARMGLRSAGAPRRHRDHPRRFGAVLVAHDWKDRPVWFARGSQDKA